MMLERFDYLIKWYLRLIVIFWLSFIPFLYLFNIFAGMENLDYLIILDAFYEMYILLPFGYDQTFPAFPAKFLRFFFWSFWGITIVRWVISGRHFYQ